MGRGYNKTKNKLKKEYMEPLKKYCEQLEKENAALKGDPSSVIGQFITQFRELYGQNSRLSVLAACLIKQLGESVNMTKEELEQFQNKRINIKWEIPDGETIETAKAYTFSYELQEATPEGQPVQTTEQPGELAFPECTDPECTLPKELKHRHDKAPIATLGDSFVTGVAPVSDEIPLQVEEPMEHECHDPNCSATGLAGSHIHVANVHVGKQLNEPVDEETCEDPDCQASENGPHVHAKRRPVTP